MRRDPKYWAEWASYLLRLSADAWYGEEFQREEELMDAAGHAESIRHRLERKHA